MTLPPKAGEGSQVKPCSHGAEHKEVLGHVLCVCCSHCQAELSKLSGSLQEMKNLHAEVSGRNVTLTCENVGMKAELSRLRSALEKIAVAEGCEGYGEVLGGKLMDMARVALKPEGKP